ncbi:MAG: Mth938-like domain-containing protein [Anaerolineales bacterium]
MTETLITDLSWGNMEVSIAGEKQHFKDCKIWPGGARAWDWGETGTHHSPGIQPADIEEILEKGVETIVLTRGQLGRLGVSSKAESFLRERGVDYHIEKTKKAVVLFNELVQKGKRVGGLFHSTC